MGWQHVDSESFQAAPPGAGRGSWGLGGGCAATDEGGHQEQPAVSPGGGHASEELFRAVWLRLHDG
eukprot:scaffold647918_cov29-Prasinocladus_malaysianus.AAC.1